MFAPILFLHGFPFNGSLWKPQIEFFQDKRIVLAPDLRGHGQGPKGNAPWMIQDYVDDLHELLTKAKIDSVVLCGLSMGGYVALEFINRYPDMVQSLILAGTRADADTNEIKDQRYQALEKIRKEGLEVFASDFSKKVLADVKSEEKQKLQDEIRGMILSNSPDDVAMVIGAIASRKDSTAMLRAIQCPTLVVVGAEDKVTSWGVNHSMARRILNCQFSKIQGAGHVVNLEQPEKFNAIVDAFLNYQMLDLRKELTNGHSNNTFALQH